MKSLLFKVHRWLGVALALLMVLWFVSGLVIVYAPYTIQTKTQQLAHAELLSPQSGWLSLGEAWDKSAAQRKTAAGQGERATQGGGEVRATANAAGQAGKGQNPAGIADARLLRQAGEPVWLVEDDRGRRFSISAIDGGLRTTSSGQALYIAANWLGQPVTSLTHVETFEHDATVRNLESWRPFHRIAAADSAGTEVLVSARTGEVLRVADRTDRALFWAGNWLHLFRPLDSLGWGESRRDVLTWVSCATVIATLTGLIVGWLRWRPGWNGKPTYSGGRTQPYRAFWFRWHFWTGLIGGTVAFLWILSGFLTNNPWQVFSPANASREELARYQGKTLPAAMRDWQPTAQVADRPDIVELDWRRLGEQAVLLASTRNGERRALPVAASRFDDASLLAGVQRLSAGTAVSTQALQTEYDSYYYPRHGRGTVDRPLPVLRVDLADAAGTRVYLDPQDGRLLLKQDESRRAYRWLFSALHHWDFGWLYARPLWDGWMLLWISFGLVLSVSSVVLGWKRLRLTFRRKRSEEPKTTPELAPQGGRL